MTAPVEPTAPPPGERSASGLGRRVYRALVSPKLAIGLLVFVLLCCLAGVTIWRGEEAGRRIFSTLWFNGLLVLLAVSSASAFFDRFWRRKRTLVSVGMIVFHLSFLGVLGGVVLNGLFSFRGTLRLAEGETMPVGQPVSYDEYEMARLFDPALLRGEVTLVKMHTNFQVNGENKRAAYELEFRDGPVARRRFVYITEYHEENGVRFFSQKEGYSILASLDDARGRRLHELQVPLQSIRQSDGSYLYTTGTRAAAGPVPFPPPPQETVLDLELNYFPGLVERTGQVRVSARPVGAAGPVGAPKVAMVPVGGRVEVGDLRLEAREIRYWVGLSVRYDPGLSTILVSLVTGLLGMVMTFVGRVRQGGHGRRGAG